MGSVTLLAATTCVMMVVMVPQVSAKRYIVGGNMGWATSGVNYTVWASDKHFYLGDWLYFVYDRHHTNLLEVNKTNYENCIADHPLANWTSGAGRDVVPLNHTRHYYFISGNGFCYGGMKLAIHVVKPPPPPSASPVKDAAQSSPSPSASPTKNAAQSPHPPSTSPVKNATQSTHPPSASPVENATPGTLPPSASPVKNVAQSTSYRGNFVLPLAFAIVANWNSFRSVTG